MTSRVSFYRIISTVSNTQSEALERLQNNVNEWVLDDYEPVGGISITEESRPLPLRSEYRATQAMILRT